MTTTPAPDDDETSGRPRGPLRRLLRWVGRGFRVALDLLWRLGD